MQKLLHPIKVYARSTPSISLWEAL